MIYYVLSGSFCIALFSGFYGQKLGYSFWRQFITGFIASAGIISLIYKLVKDYV
jgi:hypothetical protein